MPMRPGIRPHRVFFDVGADGVRGEVQKNSLRSLTSGAVIDELKAGDISDKIRIPGAMTLDDSAFAAEVSLFTAESIGKSKCVVENKIQITKAVDHDRRVCQRDEPCRLIALNVEMLAPGIERRREHAAFLPFECLLATTFSPNAGRATPLDHIDQLFEEVALRQGLALRRDFTRVTVTTASGTYQIDEGAKNPLTFPRPQRNRCQIIDGKSVVDRNAFGLLPYFIRRRIDVCGMLRQIQAHVM